MTEPLERKQENIVLGKPAQAFNVEAIKLSPEALKAIHNSEPVVAVETKISKAVVQDLRETLEACKKDLKIAQKYGLDNGKLSVLDQALLQAERTGKISGNIDVVALKNAKSIITRSKLNDRIAARNQGLAYRYRHNVHNHDLIDVRQELFAMLLNNRQLAGLQKGSKTIQEQKEELGFGGEISSDKSVDEALEERLKFLLAEEKALTESQQDRSVDEAQVEFFNVDVDTGFANELRNQSEFGFLQDNEGLEILLDGVVDIVPYIAERRAQETGRDSAEISAEIFQFQELVRKRKKKGDLVAKEDVETLLLVQYLPILYDAVNYIMDQGLDSDAVTKMQSLKGELAALIQSAADPKSAIHELFKQVKESLQDREMVEWTG
ncbi:MAG: hypothetical protein GYA55_10140 [SAR324 cluster bacterium]|uniref:Uncharacterized protein n=1 Tax=SAR324 cluster bacterium TaxID=2024889 RepID=A0A7X9ILZ9_9DELT|nr:hypothetical protein [SAR324 cluster bacterium]